MRSTSAAQRRLDQIAKYVRGVEEFVTVAPTNLRVVKNADERFTAMLKKLMRAQRTWATKVRRQPYDTFITDSFSGELLYVPLAVDLAGSDQLVERQPPRRA